MQTHTQWQTILALAAVLLVWYAVSHTPVFLWVALVLLILSALSERFVQVSTGVWSTVAAAVGSVLSTVVLAIVFYLVVTPTGLYRRMFSASTGKSRGSGRESYFVPTKEVFDKTFFERLW